MKQGEELVFAGRTMVGVSESPLSVNSLSQRPFPTPSPFSFSIASTRWSSRPSIHLSGLVLRFLALLFSFVSALSLAFPPSKKNGQFADYPELKYCFVVYVLVFIYSAFQLFKGVCDITHTGFLISDMISDYLSFILDQLAAYLLISSGSVAISIIQHMTRTASIWKATIISISISFVTFLVIATCTVLSGYKLCKRIIW